MPEPPALSVEPARVNCVPPLVLHGAWAGVQVPQVGVVLSTRNSAVLAALQATGLALSHTRTSSVLCPSANPVGRVMVVLAGMALLVTGVFTVRKVVHAVQVLAFPPEPFTRHWIESCCPASGSVTVPPIVRVLCPATSLLHGLPVGDERAERDGTVLTPDTIPGEVNVPQVIGMSERSHMTGSNPRDKSKWALVNECVVWTARIHETSVCVVPTRTDRSHGVLKPVLVGGVKDEAVSMLWVRQLV